MGKTIKDGAKRKTLLLNTVLDLGDPIAKNLTSKDFSHYCAKQLQRYKPKTLNNWQAYLSSVYNEFRRLSEIDYHNPLSELRTIKILERELSYLDTDDIKTLPAKLKPRKDTYLCTLICINCGTRWGEAKACCNLNTLKTEK
ncbi:phage integrase [Abyssogena phaseoliformis symbiont]|uniref:phage integrase n=1 Tax=Abyssogena phaseoliformis symbiont TaxID=596095 RepID=UPI00191680E0|nr:hypothetical protein [Abyssogena phaseoliformis symbiont]